VLEAVESAAGSQGTIHYGEIAYGPNEWMWMRGTNARLLETGWRPEFSIETGIADTVTWWRGRVAAGRMAE
jgi:nucleoside-diphosphate-sugar epimerase